MFNENLYSTINGSFKRAFGFTINSTSFSELLTESKSFSAQSADSADNDVLTPAEEEGDFLVIMCKCLM